MLPYFAGMEDQTYRYGDLTKITSGLPRSWKSLPGLDEGISYLWGWLAGYFAADGCVGEDGYTTLSCHDKGTLQAVVTICDRLGIGTYTLGGRDRDGFGGESKIFTLSFRSSSLPSKFFLIEEHRRRHENASQTRKYERTHWWVSSVEETDLYEEVFCAEVSTTNSFVLDGNVLTGNCLGCKSAGTILWFIATMRDCSIEEAKVWLETSAGLNTGESPEAILGFLDAIYTAHKESKQIPHLSESMLEGWKGIHPYLTDPWGPYGRQIPEANCQQMRLGYAPEYPYAGGTVQDRIIIPHFWQGQLVGWQARKIARGNEKDPKYLASPDFPKDVTVYNYDPKAETAVVMESMLSVVSKVHLRHCEATFGAVTTEDQVRLISRHEKVILFMDNDEAGWQTIEGKVNTRGKRSSSFAEKLSAHTMVFVVQNPWDADPDEITDEDFLMLVDSAVPFALWKRPVSLKPYERG